MSDVGLTAIATHCTLLEELCVSMNDLITDAPLIVLARHSQQNLLSLTLESCHSITGPGVLAITQRCPLLHTLNLNDTYEIPHADMKRIVPHLSHGKELGLLLHSVRNDTLNLISTHMPCLEKLNVASMYDPSYTVKGLIALVKRCANLKFVALGEESSLISEMVAALQKERSDLQVTTMDTLEIESG